jgi:hypothetical protein
MPRVNRAVTSELRAEPGRGWLQEEQVPTGRLPSRRSRRPLLSGLADLFLRRRVMVVCDAFRVGGAAATSARIRMMGWLAVLSCTPADRQRVEPSTMDHSAAAGASFHCCLVCSWIHLAHSGGGLTCRTQWLIP